MPTRSASARTGTARTNEANNAIENAIRLAAIHPQLLLTRRRRQVHQLVSTRRVGLRLPNISAPQIRQPYTLARKGNLFHSNYQEGLRFLPRVNILRPQNTPRSPLSAFLQSRFVLSPERTFPVLSLGQNSV